LTQNPVISTKMSLSFSGWGSFYTVEQDQYCSINQTDWILLRSQFPFLIEDDRDNIQLIKMPVYSETMWEITPPGIAELVGGFRYAIDHPESPRPGISMKYTFNRGKDGNFSAIFYFNFNLFFFK
jgi:hypothetical protein